MNNNLISRENLAEILLRAAVAVAFMYPAVDAFFNPGSWIGFFPGWMRGVIADEMLLHIFGASEMVIAVWIIFAKKIFIPNIIASLYLIGIVAFNWRFIDLLFRDVSILGISLALAVRHWRD